MAAPMRRHSMAADSTTMSATAGRSGRTAVALTPAAGAAVFGLWAGTAAGGATAAGAIAGHALLLAGAVAAAPAWCDPLGLGRRGRLLPLALWALAAASAWGSPVPRAGRVAVILLAAFLLVPAAVVRAWRGETGRRWGLLGVAAVTAASASWALAGRFLLGDPRAASPLGHHLLLGVWLLALLPVAALPALRDRGGARALGWVALITGAAALVATGSLAAWAGLALEAALGGRVVLRTRRGRRDRAADGTVSAAVGPQREPVEATPPGTPIRRRRREVAVVAAVVAGLALLAGLALPRLTRLGTGADDSTQARTVYARAGLAGAAARPALGWGPGSTPWTLAEHLRPVPGVNPPGEVVAELHALPLQVAYEVGVPGLLLAAAIAALFARRRLAADAGRDTEPGSDPTAEGVGGRAGAGALAAPAGSCDPALIRAGLIGLAGAGVALLATGWLAVTALPVALALAAGAALAGAGGELAASRAGTAAGAGEPPSSAGGRRAATGGRGWRRSWPVLLYCAAAAAALAPLDLAQLTFERALDARDPVVRRAALERAVRLDPRFPLYRFWLASEVGGVEPPELTATAAMARRAAEDGYGIAPFWLAAGVYGAGAGAPWAAPALERACDLDPLGALAPFHRMALEPAAPGAAERGARALLGAPRLAAATFWEVREELLAAALDAAAVWEGVDAGWREELLRRVTGWRTDVREGTIDLALRDPGGAESLVLRSFRRRPQGFRLAPVSLRHDLATQVPLPPATVLPTSSAAAFAGPGCGAPAGRRGAGSGRWRRGDESPQHLWKTLLRRPRGAMPDPLRSGLPSTLNRVLCNSRKCPIMSRL